MFFISKSIISNMQSASESNVLWSRPTPSTLKVEPRDLTQVAWVRVTDVAFNEARAIIPPAGLLWSIAVADDGDVGGRRVSEAEAPSTMHEIRIVSKAGGAVPNTLSEVEGNGLSFANLAAITTPGYTMMSTIQWLGSNTTGGGLDDLLDFTNEIAGVCFYQTDLAETNVLTAGKAVTGAPGAIDFTSFAPHNCMAIAVYQASNTNVAASTLGFRRDAAGAKALHFIGAIDNLAGKYAEPTALLAFPIDDPTTSVYYDFSAIPSTGLSTWCMGWILGRR